MVPSQATPHFVSGALVGIFVGDELTPQGLPFSALEKLINAVTASLASLAALKRSLIIWYNDSDNMQFWPYIPHNLTVFSADFYHPAWMYPGIGGPREVYNRWVFPKLGPSTSLYVVPATFGNAMGCYSPVDDKYCVNLTLPQWESLNLGNLTYYLNWSAQDARIVGIAPWYA